MPTGRPRREVALELGEIVVGDLPIQSSTLHGALPTRADLVTIARAQAPLDLAISVWLDAKSNRSKSIKTATAYRTTLGQFRAALQQLGHELNSDPRSVSLVAQAWAGQRDPTSRHEGDVSPATYNQRLAILSSFYVFARKKGLLDGDNPIALVDRRRVEAYAGALPLDEREVQRLLKDIDRSTLAGARDYAMLVLFLQTGRRLAEVGSLRWADVHLASDTVTIHFRRTKGGKVMADTLARGASAALLRYLHALHGPALGDLPHDSPIWVNLARNGNRSALSARSIAQICEDRLGISKVHALRHTFARTMEDAGAKVSEIQARLGHESMATTGRYLAALTRAENAHAEELARRFGFDDA